MSILLKERLSRATKPHRCIWCGEDIEIGGIYYYSVSTYDGFQISHYHIECINYQLDNMEGCEEEFDRYDKYRPDTDNNKKFIMSFYLNNKPKSYSDEK